MPWGPILSIAGALLYGASPIDMIPDIIPVLGLLDDAVVVPALIIWALVALNHRRKVSARPAPKAYIDVPASPTIPNDYNQARQR